MVYDYYKLVNNTICTQSTIKPYTPPVAKVSTVSLSDAVDITLSQYEPSTAPLIRSHRISDYRRRRFSLVLLPNVRTWLDEMLEPAGDIREFL